MLVRICILVLLQMLSALGQCGQVELGEAANGRDCQTLAWRRDRDAILSFYRHELDSEGRVKCVKRLDGSCGPKKILQSDRFVDLETWSDYLHAVDLSRYQVTEEGTLIVDLKAMRECGLRLAWVKLTQSFPFDRKTKTVVPWGEDPSAKIIWEAARAAGLVAGPYHFFRVRQLRAADVPSNPSDLQGWKQIESTVLADARDHASRFVDRFSVIAANDLPIAGILPIMIDLEQAWTTYAPRSTRLCGLDTGQTKNAKCTQVELNTALQLQNLYQKAICTWMTTVQADHRTSQAKFLLYTRVDIYQSYAINKRARADIGGCNFAELKLWLAWYPPDGRPHWADVQPIFDTVCRQNARLGKNKRLSSAIEKADIAETIRRCVAHQYSEGGRVGISSKYQGAYVDLTRFYVKQNELINFVWQAER